MDKILNVIAWVLELVEAEADGETLYLVLLIGALVVVFCFAIISVLMV